MSRYDDTSMGGTKGNFPETQWTQMLDPTRRAEARDYLAARYWRPLYEYLKKRKRIDNEQAKDLTQGFFAEVILGRDIVTKADRARGKFRNLLLVSLNNYLASVYRPKSKRAEGREVHIEQDEMLSAKPSEPFRAFIRAWAANLISETLANLKRECAENGQEVHWEVFSANTLMPLIDNTKATPLKVLCDKYGIKNEAQASNMNTTAKRRFRRLLKRRIGQYVDSDGEVDEEIGEIIRILSEGGAGF